MILRATMHKPIKLMYRKIRNLCKIMMYKSCITFFFCCLFAMCGYMERDNTMHICWNEIHNKNYLCR